MTADDVKQPDVQVQLSEYQTTLDTNLNSDKSSYLAGSHDFDQFVNDDIPLPYDNESMDELHLRLDHQHNMLPTSLLRMYYLRLILKVTNIV